MIKFKCLFVFIFLTCQSVSAQEEISQDVQSKVKISSGLFGDSIIIRWAPSDPGIWLDTKVGWYRLEKYLRRTGEPFDEGGYSLLGDRIVCADSTAFDQAIEHDPDNKYISAMAACLFGDLTTASPGDNFEIAATKADDLYNRWTFALFSADMDARAADLAGLRFVDSDVAPDYIHYHRISALDEEGNVLAQNTSVVLPKQMDAVVPVIDAVEEKERSVELKWNRRAHSRHFTAYNIERSTNRINWTQLNASPFVHATSQDQEESLYISYVDSVENYQPYYYRIIGLTHFATTSLPSDEVQAMGRDRTGPVAPINVDAAVRENKTVFISWEIPKDQNDIAKLYVGHSLYFSGPFLPLMEYTPEQNANQYTHEDPDPRKINYYIISAVDTAGNLSHSQVSSAMVPDLDPPDAPEGLEGVVSDSGVVTLTWAESNAPDIYGYQVYYGGSKNSNFTQITTGPISEASFRDTLPVRTLTDHVYYKVVAIDLRYNYSEFSDAIKLERPDVLPPSPPVFTRYKVYDSGVDLTWALSSSRDVVKHELYRKSLLSDWGLIYRFFDETINYIDTTVESGKKYQYKLVAFDEKDLSSQTRKNLQINTRNKRPPSPRLEIVGDGDRVLLKWDTSVDAAKIIVQKSINGGPFITVQRLEARIGKYADEGIREGTRYRLQLKSGALMQHSNSVEVGKR